MPILKSTLTTLLADYDRDKGDYRKLTGIDSSAIRLLRNFVAVDLRDLAPADALSTAKLAELLIIVSGHVNGISFDEKYGGGGLKLTSTLFTRLYDEIAADLNYPSFLRYCHNDLPEFFALLKKEGLLNATNAERLLSPDFTVHGNAQYFANILFRLKQEKVLSSNLRPLMDNLDRVMHADHVLNLLSEVPGLVATYAAAIIGDNNNKGTHMQLIMERLKKHRLLATHAGLAIANSQYVEPLWNCLYALPDLLSTSANLTHLFNKAADSRGIAIMMQCGAASIYGGNDQITQAFFDSLLEHSAVFNQAAFTGAFTRLPRDLFTMEAGLRWIGLCVANPGNPLAAALAIAADINRLIGLHPELAVLPRAAAGAGAIARAPDVHDYLQSTHTASVHRTATESAERLKARYPGAIEPRALSEALTQISAELEKLPQAREVDFATCDLELLKNTAALRALVRIISRGDVGDELDPASGVSVRELVALFWAGIQDDSKRTGSATKEDGLMALRNALYDIQRGTNINNKRGIDDRKRDSRICAGGTFNKLVEKLVSLHPDAEQVVVTFPEAIKSLKGHQAPSHALSYLQKQVREAAEPEQKEALKAQILAIQTAEKIGELVWGEIQEAVSTKVFEDYGSLFPEGIESEDFKDFVSRGAEAEIKAADLEKMLSDLVVEVPIEGDDSTRSAGPGR